MDTPVAVAHYWSAWNRWTLVGLDKLGAVAASGTGSTSRRLRSQPTSCPVGDCMLGTRPSLTLKMQVETVDEQPKAGDPVWLDGERC